MKKITILFFVAAVITLVGFNVMACSRTSQSSAEAGVTSGGAITGVAATIIGAVFNPI